MPDNKAYDYNELLDSINQNNDIIKRIISQKDKKIEELTSALDISESGRQTAENMVTQIKGEVNSELQKAYNNGYNAALFNANPVGGATITSENDKRLVLNQN